ncbi:MAG: RecQ family ATP-dependent DNA helicase [Fibrobacteres bacterium]|nr:RecQ family ATP-dependent DNA helicase [Fibrobacterota bacterium]
MKEILHKYFGYKAFRPNQQEIIEAVLAGRDVFAIMPTGGGKSLCYQIPSLMLPGITLVISPLISLMKDQVDAARENGISAAFLNSTSTVEDRRDLISKMRQNELNLLYISPERFNLDGFRNFLKGFHVALIAVDEAHCISEWGHDFRPDYLSLSEIVDVFPKTPIAAFTATATLKVQKDIAARLRLRSPLMVRASFNRPNLSYTVIPKGDYKKQILDILKHRPDLPGIIYRTSRKDVDFTAKLLKEKGIKALPYHAGLPDAKRKKHQEAFNHDKVQVIVATIAFGMGIDKSNVRFVMHVDMPKNMEGYYQETGRAGRDGEPAECILLYRQSDIYKIHYFIRQMSGEEQKRAYDNLNRVMRFAESIECRRKNLLEYFNETYPDERCDNCDRCLPDIMEQREAIYEEVYEAIPKKSVEKKQTKSVINEELFQALRTLRRDIADSIGMPPYIVFSDRTLQEMAKKKPKTASQLLSVTGVGEHKLRKYGKDFLDVIARFI